MSQHTCLGNRDAFFGSKHYVGGGVVGKKGISTKIPAWEEPEKLQDLNFKCIMHIML